MLKTKKEYEGKLWDNFEERVLVYNYLHKVVVVVAVVVVVVVSLDL